MKTSRVLKRSGQTRLHMPGMLLTSNRYLRFEFHAAVFSVCSKLITTYKLAQYVYERLVFFTVYIKQAGIRHVIRPRALAISFQSAMSERFQLLTKKTVVSRFGNKIGNILRVGIFVVVFNEIEMLFKRREIYRSSFWLFGQNLGQSGG